MISVSVPFMRYMGRWCVVHGPSGRYWWTWLGGEYASTARHFDTHAEAMAYADGEARK